MASLGIHGDVLGQIAEYRDQSFRLVAQIRRRTGLQIAEMLGEATKHDKGLERVVGDALEYIGFDVVRLGESGEPEGVATAPTTPAEGDQPQTYKFTYDAKSTGGKKVKTGNVNVAGLARHREKHDADHILVVAPDYESGALEEECSTNGVTPMRAVDLGKLLILVATTGHFDLLQFREVFDLHEPNKVTAWVDRFVEETRDSKRLSLDTIFKALQNIGYSGPDALTLAVIAREARDVLGSADYPTRQDVSFVLYGLSVLVPSLVRVSGENVYIGADPDTLRNAIVAQIKQIPSDLRPADAQTLVESESKA